MSNVMNHLYGFGAFQLDPSQRLLLCEGKPTVMVSHLRKVLGDDRGRHQYIETVSKHGYRFVAPVVELGGQKVTAPSAPLSRAPEVSPPEEHQPPGSLHPPSPLWSRPQVYLAGAVVVLVIAGSALFFASRVLSKSQARSAVPPAGSIHSIAVLPFRTIGSAAADEYLGLGTTDALITKLGNAGKLIVRPTSAI